MTVDNQILAIITYKTAEELDALFTNSTPLEYLEGEELEKPLFIGLFNQTQLETLSNQGFIPEIIDQNADLSRYSLLYHPAPSQSAKLTDFGEVFPISAHFTFLKVPLGSVFNHVTDAPEFHEMPFAEVAVTPKYKTVKITAKPTQKIIQELPSDTAANQMQSSSPLLPLGIFSVLFISIISYILFKRGSSKRDILVTAAVLTILAAVLTIIIL